MQFQKGSRSRRGLTVGGVAVVMALTPAAFGQTARATESTQDVFKLVSEAGDTAAGGNTSAELAQVRFVHPSRRVVTTSPRLVFSRFVPKGVDEIRNELFSSRPDGSDIKRLTFGHDNVFARWSAGGHRILYLRDGRVWMMGANGRHKQRIVGGDNFGGADWAPGGRRIVVARGIDRTTLVVHSLTTGVSRRLTGDYASPGHPRWSPDGKRILFEATSSPRTDVRDLYTIKPNGKGLRNLTSTTRFDEFDADWSPAGDRIVYVRDRIGPCQRLHVMRADGTRDRRIGRGCSDAEPTWSPNARRILFSPLDDRFGVSHLVVIALNGSHRHVVTEGQWPDWRP